MCVHCFGDAEARALSLTCNLAELVVHLTQQAELTSKLWEDSIYVSGKVSDANQQLQKAKDRNRESRVWLLVFLVGSSLTLLCKESVLLFSDAQRIS